MNFEDVLNFIESRMRMSHIYQPVMLMALLRSRGELSEREIAKAILAHDESQIEYYERIARGMVGRVLRSHDVVEFDRVTKNYKLVGFENLSQEERGRLIDLCEAKLEAYLEKRGANIFQHRKKSAGYISGTLKYEVLKRAQFHCELCGIAADKKALEVDHIIPRNKGGSDDLENLQALCYSCNAMKRDRDDTDFRKVRESFDRREPNCVFCQIPEKRILFENELAFAIYDKYPVTALHALVIAKRHIDDYFELSRPEINACNSLLAQLREIIQHKDISVSGFNIGVNNGDVAGQTVFHCHVHLIPRRKGDVENPRGGVRNIVDGRSDY
jgi:ATP adenylyltransferase